MEWAALLDRGGIGSIIGGVDECSPVGREIMAKKKPIEQYDHRDKERLNNPPVGLVTPETDPESGSVLI